MLVSAVDIGSTSIKACVFELGNDGSALLKVGYSKECPLLHLNGDWYDHDLTAARWAFQELLERLPRDVPIGLSTAMHALVPLDVAGRPLCNAISWADGRSSEQAKRLRRLLPTISETTGTPIHPMAWPSKLLWIKEQRPDWWSQLRGLTDLKSYLLSELAGRAVPLDISSASATGLWDQQAQCWSSELCDFLELEDSRLPEVSSDSGYALELAGRQVYLGAGDGPLGNLGTGAVIPGRVAVSVGTSGACRRFCDTWSPPPKGLFRYHLDSSRWVEGGAISNGGSVLSKLSRDSGHSPQELLELLVGGEPGARGFRVYPYYQGERAPFWLPGVRPAELGRRCAHTLADEVRANLEAVAYSLQRLLTMMPSNDEPLRCTGGMFASPIWCQLLADVTGRNVAVSPEGQATALGAALMTQPDYLDRSRLLKAGRVTLPGLKTHSLYRELYDEWADGDPYRCP